LARLTPLCHGPFEGGDQPAIFDDVVGGDADGVAELLDQRAVALRDSHAVTGRSGLPRSPPSM
jgi:hypothetical protein